MNKATMLYDFINILTSWLMNTIISKTIGDKIQSPPSIRNHAFMDIAHLGVNSYFDKDGWVITLEKLLLGFVLSFGIRSIARQMTDIK